MHDPPSLSRAISGAEGVLLVWLPKSLDPSIDWIDEQKSCQGVADGTDTYTYIYRCLTLSIIMLTFIISLTYDDMM